MIVFGGMWVIWYMVELFLRYDVTHVMYVVCSVIAMPKFLSVMVMWYLLSSGCVFFLIVFRVLERLGWILGLV